MSDGWTCIAGNPQSGVSTWMLRDGEDAYIQTRQAVDTLLDENTAIRNIAADGWKGDSLHSVARIPLSMMHDQREGIGQAIRENDENYVKKFLNDSNHAKLRTKDGNI